MKTIKDLDLKDKNILVRVDYNVPLKDKKVESDLRIRASLPTINYLLENGAKKIILISHLGRPEGKENPEFSLSPVAEELQKLLGQPVDFKPLPQNGEKIKSNAKIILLENLRFDPGEEENSKDFIKNIIGSVDADVIVCQTASGTTALTMAAQRPNVPIISVTPNPRVANQLALTYANSAFVRKYDENFGKELTLELKDSGYLLTKPGKKDLLAVIVSGDKNKYGTDTIKIRHI